MAADPSAPKQQLFDIRLTGVSKSFAGRTGLLEVVSGLDLVVAGGETVALVGASGCGKSTLLRLAAGLDTPDRGAVSLGGADPGALSRAGQLAVAFQEDALLPWRTLRGNVALARRLARLPADPARVDALIAEVGLAGFEDRRPAELSGGMRQRAAIARCLATRPAVLFLDEPFGAVDALTRRRLNVDLPPVWGAGQTTVLLVTHSVSEAVLLSDRVVVLSPRPARIVNDIPVPLPRPRQPDMLQTAIFRDAVAAIDAALEAAGSAATRDLAAE